LKSLFADRPDVRALFTVLTPDCLGHFVPALARALGSYEPQTAALHEIHLG
jgi:hypothetical protein